MRLNETILKHRKKQNLTQEQIATMLGISAPAVNKWEKGASYPDITLLKPLARILKIDLDTLLSFNEDLDDIEINNIIEELNKNINDIGYEKTYEKSLTYIRQYPTNNKLILFIAQMLEMYLYMIEDDNEDKY